MRKSLNLSLQLALATTLFAVLAALAITGIQMLGEGRALHKSLEQQFSQMETVAVPSLEDAIWSINAEAVRATAGGLASQSGVNYVAVSGLAERPVEFGRRIRDAAVREFPLMRWRTNIPGGSQQIGSLLVEIDRPSIERGLQDKYRDMFLSNLLLIGLVAGFVLLLLEQRVMQHIRRIARFVDSRDTRNLDQPLALSRRQLGALGPDEVGLLAQGVNRMQDNLRLAFEQQREDLARVEAAEAAVRSLNTELEARVERRTRQLRSAQEAAEAASQAKADFLANMSHEIRTPMNAIFGMGHLLQKTALDPVQRDYLDKIQNSGAHLLGVVNDILDLSKIEGGKMVLEQVEFETAGLLDNVATLIGEKARQKGLALSFDVAPDVPAVLRGDPLRLGQILINYGNNAVKFTDQGSIRFGIAVLEDGGDDVLLRLAVRDTGIGMTTEQAARMFRSFEQADASITRRYGGTGLGLSICRQLAELMGGSVGVDSVPGQGSTFWLTLRLPRGTEQPQAVGAQAAPGPQADLARLLGARVLLAEDNAINQQVFFEMLQDAGIQVDIAANGHDALAMVEAQTYDAVLMDVQMPVLDGLEATRLLRAQPRWARLPILALTASVLPTDQAHCRAAGMNGFIAKPVDPAVLLRTLAQWIAPRPGEQAAAAGEAPAPASTLPFDPAQRQALPPAIAGLDLDLGLQLSGGKAQRYLALLGRFCASEASAAERIRQSLQAGDAALAERMAHTTKGLAAQVGAQALARAAGGLEDALRADGAAPDTLLDAFARALDAQLAAIVRALPEAPESPAASTAPADRQAQAAAWRHLVQLLLRDDAKAERWLGECEALLQQDLPEGFAQLRRAVRAYDFERALQLVPADYRPAS